MKRWQIIRYKKRPLEVIIKYSHSIYIKIEKKEFDSKKKLLKNFFIASLTLEKNLQNYFSSKDGPAEKLQTTKES